MKATLFIAAQRFSVAPPRIGWFSRQNTSCLKIRAELNRGLEVNRLHPQRRGRIEILHPVVDEQRPPGLGLRHAERPRIDRVCWLANAEPAGREERGENLTQTEMSNAEIVQGLALVVERGQSNTARRGEVSRDRNAVGPGNALREHERRKFLAAERAPVAKHSDVEILVERDLTRLECADRLFVPVLKIILVERS